MKRASLVFWGLLLVLGLLGAGAAFWFTGAARTEARHSTERLRCALPAQPATAPHPGMVWVPGGSFELGDTVYPEEQPVRPTRVAGFWMDRTEVTNDEFARFVAATGYVTVAERALDAATHPGLPADLLAPGAVVFIAPNDLQGRGDLTQWWRYTAGAQWRHPGGPATSIEGRGAFPVVTLALQDAQAYARWLGRTLPTEAQWEWAARAGQTQAGLDHDQPAQANTWQGLFPVVNSGEDGFVGLAPVGCYPPNAWGLFDLIGNVWELTADVYHPNHRLPAQTPPEAAGQRTSASTPTPTALDSASASSAARSTNTPSPAPAPGQHVIKGGSFLCAPNYCMRYRSGSRQAQDDELGTSHVGFRTVLNAPGP